ncbi:hypothetical protein [Hyphomicrobium sp.]|uniref:hypothetical protein n=1 Tax=Hyphomicrobium sp. TaxID=82 RepID=UPI001DDEAE95|nr:hypothetical protein [Hyphomicrobium sp.]MBY0561517.1 hypothetical protein [Hyphomicrobium sp.]
MSYCRWSSADWSCDLYCYEDVAGGWTTHVAVNRIVGDVPKTPDWPDKRLEPGSPELMAWAAAMSAAMKAQDDWLDTADRVSIGGPYDGRTFNSPTLEEFKALLLELRAAGYPFPDYVLETVNAEIQEGRDPAQ